MIQGVGRSPLSSVTSYVKAGVSLAQNIFIFIVANIIFI